MLILLLLRIPYYSQPAGRQLMYFFLKNCRLCLFSAAICFFIGPSTWYGIAEVSGVTCAALAISFVFGLRRLSVVPNSTSQQAKKEPTKENAAQSIGEPKTS